MIFRSRSASSTFVGAFSSIDWSRDCSASTRWRWLTSSQLTM